MQHDDLISFPFDIKFFFAISRRLFFVFIPFRQRAKRIFRFLE